MKGAVEGYVERASSRDLQKPGPNGFLGPTQFKQSRLNYEWLNPELYGVRIKGSKTDSFSRASLFGKDEKQIMKS